MEVGQTRNSYTITNHCGAEVMSYQLLWLSLFLVAFYAAISLQAAVMIATDVASRGLDFSDVDWVVQVDCPASVEDYIHR